MKELKTIIMLSLFTSISLMAYAEDVNGVYGEGPATLNVSLVGKGIHITDTKHENNGMTHTYYLYGTYDPNETVDLDVRFVTTPSMSDPWEIMINPLLGKVSSSDGNGPESSHVSKQMKIHAPISIPGVGAVGKYPLAITAKCGIAKFTSEQQGATTLIKSDASMTTLIFDLQESAGDTANDSEEGFPWYLILWLLAFVVSAIISAGVVWNRKRAGEK